MTTSLQQFNDQQYLCLETNRKSGVGVRTPVWFTEAGGRFYVWTQRNSGKTKRVRNSPSVRVVPSTARGVPQREWTKATAGILEAGTPEYASGHQLVRRKYGVAFRLFEVVATLRRDPFVVLEITPAR